MSKHIQTGQQRGGSPIVFKSGVPISVICVAATFTSLSYANNGGKVQLVSAGVHGLTTSPAVGASVYVSWASGTGVSGLYKVSSVDDTLKFTIDLMHTTGLGTPTVAIANTEITAMSFNIPPLANNSAIKEYVSFSMTASTNTRIIYNRLSSAFCGSMGTTSSSYSGGAFYTVIKNQNNKSVQLAMGNINGLGFQSTSNTPTSVDTSVPTTLTISAKMTAANEFVKIENVIIEVFL